MARLNPRLGAALSVVLSAGSGAVTNMVTQKWSWTLGVGLVVLVLAAAGLAWHTTATAPAPGTTVRQRATGKSRIEGGRIDARQGARVEETARDNATIENSTITTTGGNVVREAEDSVIRGNELKTD